MRMRALIDNVLLTMADDDGDYLNDTRMLAFADKALREINELCRSIHGARKISVNAEQANYGMLDTFTSFCRLG